MYYFIEVFWLAGVEFLSRIDDYSVYTTLNPLRSLALRYNMVGNWLKRFHGFPARIVLTLENDNYTNVTHKYYFRQL
jgi:hypothetical protein